MVAGVKVTQQEAAARFAKIGAELKGTYVNANTKVLVRCLVHDADIMASPASAFRGAQLLCCKNDRFKLDAETVWARAAAKGYRILDEYINVGQRLHMECSKHEEVHQVLARSVLCDGKSLPCCGLESMRKKMTGRPVSDEFRARMSSRQIGVNAYWYGKTLSKEHRENIAAAGARAFKDSVERHIAHARSGVTSGKPGFFYIFRVGKVLKFGSVCRMKPEARIAKIRRDTGKKCQIMLLAQVPDAGEYEAMMMERFREFWVSKEFFKPALLSGN